MNIVVPLDNAESVEALVSAGATEFFTGVVTEQWTKQYSTAGSINRRESKGSNFSDYLSLATATRLAHDLGAKVFLTLNAHYYLAEQYSFIDEALDQAARADVDAVIVADLGLMEHIKQAGCHMDLHVSSEAMVINREAVNFLRQFGVKRIICPREISLSEIADMTTGNGDLEFESFILRERCPFAGALCQTTHGLTKNYFCSFGWKHRYFGYGSPAFSAEQEKEIRVNDMYYSMWAGYSGSVISLPSCLEQEIGQEIQSQRCGICSVPALQAAGIRSLKIAGRGLPLDRKLEYVRFVRRALDQLQDQAEHYKQFCRSLKGSPEYCDLTYNCYYR